MPTKTKADKVAEVRRRNGYYRLGDRKFISVTTVLSTLNKPALINWAAKQAAGLVLDDPHTYSTAEDAAAGIRGVTGESTSRGSEVHGWVERINLGETIDLAEVSESARGYVEGYLRFYRLLNPVVVYAEANLFSKEHGYAGTADIICSLPGNGFWCLDIKTGKRIYDEVALQLAAYKHADTLVDADNKERLMPQIDRTGVILLDKAGDYIFSETGVDNKTVSDFEAFLALKKVLEWQKESAA